MIFDGLLVPAVISAAVGAVVIATASAGKAAKDPRFKTTGARLEPLLLDSNRADWSQAPVYAADLLIRYEEPGGEIAETVIQPKSIMGRKVGPRGIRPDTVNAFCRTGQTMRVFNYDKIVWAADAKSGEFIEDLYGYLGGAQPGGAPSPLYDKVDEAVELKHWKRHW